MTLVYLFAAAALAGAVAGAVPLGLRALSAEDRRAVVTVVLVTAWPLSWTFLFGPLLVGTPASPLFPLAWYAPAAAMALLSTAAAGNDRGVRIDLPTLLVFATSVLALIAAVAAPKDGSDLLRWGMGFLLVLPALLKGRVTVAAVAVGCRLALVLTAVAVLVAVLVEPTVVEACRADKCGAAGLVLTSPFAGNGNVLGLSVALLLPFALAGAPARPGGQVRQGGLADLGRSVALTGCVVALGELAGSRTAFIGVGIVVAVHLALRLCSPRLRPSILGVGLFAGLAVSLAPAVLVFGDEAFSFRGELWNQARSMIAESPLLGSGPTAWEKFGRTAVYDANYSPHNGWLDMLVSVGACGTVIVVAAVILKLWLATPDEREDLVVYVCGLLGTSTLEALFVPYFLGITPFAAILLLLVGPGGRTRGSPPDARAESTPAESPPEAAPPRAPAPVPASELRQIGTP